MGKSKGASIGDRLARGWRRVRWSRHIGRAVERPFGEKWRAFPSARVQVGLPGLKALAAAAKEPKPFPPLAANILASPLSGMGGGTRRLGGGAGALGIARRPGSLGS